MLTNTKFRTRVFPAGSFVSLPEAFKDAPEGLRYTAKVEFQTRVAEDSPSLKLENTVTSDIILFDLAAIGLSDVDYKKVARDCELVKEAALNHPDKLQQLLAAFQPGAPASDVHKAFHVAKELGLTEELTVKAGGGILPLIIIGVALLCAGCMGHCQGHVQPAKSPSTHVDAGTH